MALTASSLIDSALQRTFGGTGAQKVSKAMLLSELSFQDQLIVQMLSQIAPDMLATTTGVIALTDGGNTNGYSLSAGIHYRDFVHFDGDDKYTPVNIVQRKHRESYPTAPAGMMRLGSTSGVFYPIDPLGKRWGGTEDRLWFEPASSHTVSYSYVPLPAQVTSLASTLSSPDMAREAIVSSLELQILLSTPDLNEARVQGALAKRQGAMDALRMQAYKFVNPQGQPGGAYRSGDANWVNDQVGR
jgi:hypothetical protein